MRPQSIPYAVVTTLLLFSSIVLADQFHSPLNFGIKMREKSITLENNPSQDSLSRLTSYVLELSYGDLLYRGDLRHQGFPQEQLACQRAITHGSISYVRKWIDATERGMTPEAATRVAGHELDRVTDVCNVPVIIDAAGIKIPSVGSPCSQSIDVFVDAKNLQACLQQTLEFWTSYLYIPANQ